MPSPLTIQPDPTAGKDAALHSASPTTPYGDNAGFFYLGDPETALSSTRILIAFSTADIPAGATITAVTLSLWEYYAENGAGASSPWAVNVRRVLVDWVEAQATWNVYKTGSNWPGSAGCGTDGTDRVGTASCSVNFDATAAGDFVGFGSSGLVDDVQGWLDSDFSNYGWLLSADAIEQASASAKVDNRFCPSDYTTDTAKRPKLVVTYTEVSTIGVRIRRLIG